MKHLFLKMKDVSDFLLFLQLMGIKRVTGKVCFTKVRYITYIVDLGGIYMSIFAQLNGTRMKKINNRNY